ncbi:hypothetical protein CBL_01138 [Carabus blaptoides fortunei]
MKDLPRTFRKRKLTRQTLPRALCVRAKGNIESTVQYNPSMSSAVMKVSLGAANVRRELARRVSVSNVSKDRRKPILSPTATTNTTRQAELINARGEKNNEFCLHEAPEDKIVRNGP